MRTGKVIPRKGTHDENWSNFPNESPSEMPTEAPAEISAIAPKTHTHRKAWDKYGTEPIPVEIPLTIKIKTKVPL